MILDLVPILLQGGWLGSGGWSLHVRLRDMGASALSAPAQGTTVDADDAACSLPGGLEHGGLTLQVASDRLTTGSFLAAVTGAGTMGAFFAIVFLGAFRAVRGFTAGFRYRLSVDELPDCRDLVDLVNGVYMARRRCDLLRETELYDTVIRLYRSSEALLALTGGELKHE